MIKKVLFFLFFVCLLIVSHTSEAQPNDFQCSASNLGILKPAPPCGAGGGINSGMDTIFTGTTIGSSSDPLSSYITSCYSGAPLHDVWYSFIATNSHIEITLSGITTSPLTDPYVALYESLDNDCVGLTPRACGTALGTGSNIFDFGPLIFGGRYYIQIASTVTAGDGKFALDIKSKNVCDDCMKNSIVQAFPRPLAASYPPDTTVGFCYSVVGYDEQYGNRFHGVVPIFGNGWDTSTFNVVLPAVSADGAGAWQWFSNVNVNGVNVNGFFYNVGPDFDPTNNLGDHAATPHIWTFCFTIRTNKKIFCDLGQDDLSIDFENYSDAESGSLISSQDCSGDPDYIFDAHMNCCPKPAAVSHTGASCNLAGDGSISINNPFSSTGYQYALFDQSGVAVATNSSLSGTSFGGLNEGNYYINITNIQLGCTTPVSVYIEGPISYSVGQTVFACGTGCANNVQITINSGTVNNMFWDGTLISSSLVTGVCPGWHHYLLQNTSIPCTISDSIFVIGFPPVSVAFAYDQTYYCTSDTLAFLTDFPADAGGTFNLLTPLSGVSINNATGEVSFSPTASSGMLIIKYQSGPPCFSSRMDTIFLSTSPPPVSIFSDHFLCPGDSAPLFYNSFSVNDINWFLPGGMIFFTQSPGTSFDPFSLSSPVIPGANTFYVTQVNSSTSSGCESAPTLVTINFYNSPAIIAGSPITVCSGFGANLNASGASSYIWSPSGLLNNPSIANPIATISQTTMFTVVGTDAISGCKASDSVTVFIDTTGTCDIVVFNGFTPNGDNHNDYWYIDGISSDKNNEVSIFNRWGDKVWATKGYDNQSNRWDGKGFSGSNLPDGTYFFIINVKDKTLKGYVELTR
jgi:gliding motility-associated-like protein